MITTISPKQSSTLLGASEVATSIIKQPEDGLPWVEFDQSPEWILERLHKHILELDAKPHTTLEIAISLFPDACIRFESLPAVVEVISQGMSKLGFIDCPCRLRELEWVFADMDLPDPSKPFRPNSNLDTLSNGF